MTKKILFLISIFIFTFKIVFSAYIIFINLENCNNILIETEDKQNVFNIQESYGKPTYNVCLRYYNYTEKCYSIYELDLYLITSKGLVKVNYVSITLDKVPHRVMVLDNYNNLICESDVIACIKDGICNSLCIHDEDCQLKTQIIDLEKRKEIIEFQKIPDSIKILIIAIIVIVSIIIWKIMK